LLPEPEIDGLVAIFDYRKKVLLQHLRKVSLKLKKVANRVEDSESADGEEGIDIQKKSPVLN